MKCNTRFRFWLAGILCGAAGLYVLGNGGVPLWDRDEPRYAECSREMLRSGDWVVPRFLGALRTHKPPFIYWCQAAAMSVVGESGFAARLPSALAVALTAMLLAIFVGKMGDWRRAVWTAVVFCTSALAIAAAKLAITDGVLLLWICIGQGCLYLMWNGRRTWDVVIVFWVATALAGLTKGPVVLAMHAGTMGVLAAMEIGGKWRSGGAWKQAMSWWRWVRPVVGIVILVGVVAPWLVLVNRRAPDFLPALLHRAGKYTSGGAEGHAEPPGYYLLIIWGLLFPWSLILPAGIGTGIRNRSDPLMRFSLAAAIGPWVVMELVVNKLPFYILPSFPALAILIAEAIVRGIDSQVGGADWRRTPTPTLPRNTARHSSPQAGGGEKRGELAQVSQGGATAGVDDDLKRGGFLFGVAIWAAAMLGVCGLPVVAMEKVGGPRGLWIAWMVIGIIYAIVVSAAWIKRRIRVASMAMGAGMAILAAILFGGILPNVACLSSSRVVGGELQALGAGGSTRVAMTDYREPSLAFYQGGGAFESNLGDLTAANSPEWAVVTAEGFASLPDSVHLKYRIVTTPLRTLVYNDGWYFVDLEIVRRN